MKEAPGFPELPLIPASQDHSQHGSLAKPQCLPSTTSPGLRPIFLDQKSASMEVFRSCAVLSAYALVTVSKMMPSDDQYPNHQSHDQMLVRNAGSQTCWVVFLGSHPNLTWLSPTFCITQLPASASDQTEATAVRAGVGEGDRIRSWRENPEVWWEGAEWFRMHRVELCLEKMQITTAICLPASMTLIFLHALLAFASGVICTQTYPASQCIPP